jgi:integrase
MAKDSGGWKKSLAAVLKAHGRYSADGHKVVSYATTDKRSDVLFSGFRELRALGYKLNDVRGFRETHLKALVSQWEHNGQSPATIQNKISVFRTFSEWIGKAGMVRASEQYVADLANARRSSIAQEDKSWSAKGVDIPAKLEAVKVVDARVGLQLELQATFGLRAKEAMVLKPHLADKGTYLAVSHGTKGGRDRVVPIDTPAKRELIDQAKTLAASKLASTSDPAKTLAQVRNHYYQVLRQCGITRAEGITSHGLRHEYANAKYQALTGQASPVRGGAAGAVSRGDDKFARQGIAEDLGHSRESITTHYLGR